MRKVNVVFLGECIIIVALLLLIGNLLRTEESYVWGKEATTTDGLLVEEDAPKKEEESGITQFAKDLLGEQQSLTVSGNWDMSVSGNQVSGNSVSANQAEGEAPQKDDKLRIAVFGDSIWDSARGVDGIAEKLEGMLGAKVFNCAIGGSTAAVVSETTNMLEGWSSWSLNGLMYAAKGEVSPDSFLSQTSAYEPIKEVDFDEVDYLVIAYGLNDFFSRVKIYPQDMFDMTTYVGALRHGVAKMQEAYPDLKIILIGPTYCEQYADPNVDSLERYVEGTATVADEYDTYFIDMYHDMGIDGVNKNQYLADGVHLNAEGRQIYAEDVAELISGIEAGQ